VVVKIAYILKSWVKPIELTTTRGKFRFTIFVLACLGFAVPLFIFMLIGANMRYNGDDYCYAANLVRYGFFGVQVVAYQEVGYYNGNRFSLNLFSAIADLFGPFANGVWPALAVLLWLIGIWFGLKTLSKLLDLEISDFLLAAGSEALVFFTLAHTQDISQSLFWRSGMLPYLAPIIGNIFLVVILLKQNISPHLQVHNLVGAVIVSFLSAGFSETGAVVQTTWLGLLFIFLIIRVLIQPNARPGLTKMLFITIGSIVASAAAMVFLAVSPTVLMMKPQLGESLDIIEIFQYSIRYTRRFFSTLKISPLEYTIPTAVFAALAMIHPFSKLKVGFFNPRKLVAIFFGIAICTYTLVLSSMVAFSYAQRAFPEPRAVIIPQFILTCSLCALGFLTGIIASEISRKINIETPIMLLSGIMVLICLSSPMWTGRVYWGELPRYQRWSAFWDRRDHELRQLKNHPTQEVHVVAIDHIIPRVGDLGRDRGSWYNQCASIYYGLEAIYADLPGWDD